MLKFIEFLLIIYEASRPSFQKNRPGTNVYVICDVSSKNEELDPELEISFEILSHPAVLKLFLQTENTPKYISKIMKNSSRFITMLVLEITSEIMDCNKKEHHSYFRKYKQKILNYIHANSTDPKCDDLELLSVIGTFLPLFSSQEIVLSIENLLTVQISESSFSLLMLLLKRYLEAEDLITLSPPCIDSLVLKYAAMTKKQKKIFIDLFLRIFRKHPTYGLHVNKGKLFLSFL